MEYIIKKISHPWIVVNYSGVYQFATRKEAVAFAEAEQAEWDEGMRDYYRRCAEEGEEISLWNRERSGDA